MHWIRVCAVEDCPPGEARELVAGERIIALYNVAGEFYALDGICPHQGGPLGKGFLNGCIVTCPWHGFQFDVTTGQHQTSASLVHPSYPVKLEANEVFIGFEET
jgi:nitrite reductase/ring-hydroxylating ferredoxin subunit